MRHRQIGKGAFLLLSVLGWLMGCGGEGTTPNAADATVAIDLGQQADMELGRSFCLHEPLARPTCSGRRYCVLRRPCECRHRSLLHFIQVYPLCNSGTDLLLGSATAL